MSTPKISPFIESDPIPFVKSHYYCVAFSFGSKLLFTITSIAVHVHPNSPGKLKSVEKWNFNFGDTRFVSGKPKNCQRSIYWLFRILLNFEQNWWTLYQWPFTMRICKSGLHLTYVYAKFYMSDLEFKPISVQCMFVLTNANSAQNVSPKSKHPFFTKFVNATLLNHLIYLNWSNF